MHTTHTCLCTRMEASVMPPNCYLGADNRGLGVSRGVEGLSAGGHSLQLHVGQTLAVTGRHLGTQWEGRVSPWGSPVGSWRNAPQVMFGVLPTGCESAPRGLRGI